jgi:double-stranded uracil-DNA glycosylase
MLPVARVPTLSAMGTRRFTQAELQAYRGASVDDLIGSNVRLMFVGINPGLWTAAVNTHFARPGNRFWPAMFLAGITVDEVDASDGLTDVQRSALTNAGVAITNIADVATARADELTAAQLSAGGEQLRARVRHHRPDVVAVLGVTAFRQAFGRRGTVIGPQDERFEGSALWVLPNPSGLNAHETVMTLASWYRSAAEAAGVTLHRELKAPGAGSIAG